MGGGDSKVDQRKARDTQDALSFISQQQASARQTLQNSSNASAEELRASIPFLKTRALQEQARYEADVKEQHQAFETSLGAPLLADTTLVDNMRNADPEKYQQWRTSLMTPEQMQAPTVLPSSSPYKAPAKPSTNSMKAAQKLWDQSYQKNQAMMAPHRGPLSPNNRNEAALMLPNPLNGIVI